MNANCLTIFYFRCSVDVVVWAILYNACPGGCQYLVNFSSLSQHMSNFFWMSIDFLLTQHAFDIRHFHFILLYPVSFAIFHFFWSLAGRPPIYFFMDPTDPFQPLWIIAVLFIHLFFFLFAYLISRYALKRLPVKLDGGKGDRKELITHDAENPKFEEIKN